MHSMAVFFNDTATTEIVKDGHTLSLHDALPVCARSQCCACHESVIERSRVGKTGCLSGGVQIGGHKYHALGGQRLSGWIAAEDSQRQLADRKSTRLNSSH